MEHWEQVIFKAEDDDWETLDENGWFAMMAWAAGPDNVRNSVQSDAGRTVRVTCLKDGVQETWLEPFTPEDRAGTEEGINSYIGDAGIPPRPSGFVWHLRVPAGWAGTESVIDTLGRRLSKEQQNGVHPADLWPHFERIVSEFYAARPA